jgi:hypothetical protein
MLTTYTKLTADVVARVGEALEVYREDRSPDAPSLASVRTTWAAVPDQLAAINATRVSLGDRIASIASDYDLTPAARDRQIEAVADVAWIAVKRAAADIEARVATMLDTTKAAIYPTRPEPADAAQEARLAGIKADVRMACDPLADGEKVLERVKTLLARALANGDDLAGWLLAASDWTPDYLESRGFGLQVPALRAAVDQVIERNAPDRRPAITLYRALSDRQRGLPTLQALLGGVLAQVFDQTRTWRPTSISPRPPQPLQATR